MDLSIIIVNWNSKDYLRKCIASIIVESPVVEFEIIVIDGGSFDGCGEMLRQKYPEVRFIQSNKNLGFGRANNKALEISKGRNILFLNPDTELVGSPIQKLLQNMEKLSKVGAVGAKLLNTDGTVQMSCIRAFPTLINQILESDILRKIFRYSKLWGMAHLFDGSIDAVEVDAVSGACLMIKRKVFEKIGMFSTDYFMYSEEIDLCYKLKKNGFKSYFIPSAVIVHHGGASSSMNDTNTFSSIMMLESRLRYFRKTKPLWYCNLYKISIIYAGLFRIVIIIILWPYYALCGKINKIKSILKKWVTRVRWASGGEVWVKKY